MHQKTFGDRAPPGTDRGLEAHSDVIRAVDVVAWRSWKGTPRLPSRSIGAFCDEDEGKWMWKLDEINGKWQRWMGAGNLVENRRCQRLHFEVKMHQKTLGDRVLPGPAGRA